MPLFPRSKAVALFIAYALLCPTLLLAQSMQETRPRRAVEPAETGAPISQTTKLSSEPTVRIGLATNARSVTISTAGRLMKITDESAAPEALEVARVRIEPRVLAPLPPTQGTDFSVEIQGAATRVDAERAAREIKEQTGESAEVSLDAQTNTWKLRIGGNLSRADADELRARLEEAGFVSATVTSARTSSSTNAGNRQPSGANPARPRGINPQSASQQGMTNPVSRVTSPTRAAVVYASGASMLFTSYAPVVFSSDDERASPVRFNEKPYRGRLEVFANAQGGLTVVNVLGMEDYVRGVVPNELNYPAIEALKAQAVAARTYAFRNKNQFASQGFDLLPTTRSQVYGGLSTEQPLASRAVEETRGVIATYRGEPINALYTSTCGGRTEDSENIFPNAEPYLRARECSIEGRAAFAPFIVKTSREPAEIMEEANLQLARDVAVLSVNNFSLGTARINDSWLSASASASEVRNWIAAVARLSRNPLPAIIDDVTRPPAFSTALAAAVYGEGRADTLMDAADVEYILSFRDAQDIPERNRADVAYLLRDGFLSLHPDVTIRPREAMSRARMLHTIASILEARGRLLLQKGTAKPASAGALVLRSTKSRDLTMAVASDAYLFRAFGATAYQVRSLTVVGGEPVQFHLNSRGEVDYMEVRPAAEGASAERFSPFTNWTAELSLNEAQARLSRWARGVGSLTDLRVAARGSSRRVTDLELVGTTGTAHVRGGRIRSALGLREQLFVIERRYDDAGRVTGFTFTGRGWGHGVGLCQVGAYGMARAGLSYDKILRAYYTGIELTKLY
ncbi:MAG: SpoIID/LytB domain-containing protein [Pyrinomonadaceae bacterium]|nr:SpoIID/LytB domain-containing protein [Pyrinomonadaceae bacterium]